MPRQESTLTQVAVLRVRPKVRGTRRSRAELGTTLGKVGRGQDESTALARLLDGRTESL